MNLNTLYARLNVNDGDEIFKSKVRITRPQWILFELIMPFSSIR